MTYKGSLTEEERAHLDSLYDAHGSVRKVARKSGISYPKVRYYFEHKDERTLVENHLKVLFYDIETAPLLAHVWHTFGDWVSQDQLLGDQFMLTWAAKWYGESEVLHDRLTPKEARAQDDHRITGTLADLIREADVIVAHNGDRFDLPVVNKRLLLDQLEPLGPKTTIDTLKLAKYNFKFERNSLDFLAERLLGARKIKTEFSLWREAYQGEEKALKEMDEYCQRDVEILEQVFDAMKPYVKRLTRLVDGPDFSCPFCGSPDVQKRGVYRTQVSVYQKFQCQECARYSRSKTIKNKRHPLHPL